LLFGVSFFLPSIIITIYIFFGLTAGYLAIRSNFARTLAAFNICSYIVGIGDRHLENFLLDLNTCALPSSPPSSPPGPDADLPSGELIGIDFGHAFDSATVVLPMPARATLP
jgi:DNA-dependent protein kinase catalytic subunit